MSTKYDYETLREAVVQSSLQSLEPRQTIISACGTGKTRQACALLQAHQTRVSLVFEPSLALISQSLGVYKEHLSNKDYLILCSDKSVTQDPTDLVTLAPRDVRDALLNTLDKYENDLIIFCTYHSVDVLRRTYSECPHVPQIDLCIFDEAHRAATKEENSSFSLALSDQHVPLRKRIFMTATPRLFDPTVNAYSMDDEATFGPTIFNYSNKQAVADGLIKPFEVCICTVGEQFDEDTVLGVNAEVNLKADALAIQIAIKKAINEFDVKHLISFHSSVEDAAQMSHDFNLFNERSEWASDYVSGEMSASTIGHHLDLLGRGHYLLSNCRVIGTGVNVPQIDCVIFADPKTSIIETVQNIGRGQRKLHAEDNTPLMVLLPLIISKDKKTIQNLAYFVDMLSVLLNEDDISAFGCAPSDVSNNVPSGNRRKAPVRFLNCDKALDEAFIDSIQVEVLKGIKRKSPNKTLDEYVAEARLFKTIKEWRDNCPVSYVAATLRGFRTQIIELADLERLRKSKRDLADHLSIASSYTSFEEFYEGARDSYVYLRKAGYLNEVFPTADISAKTGPKPRTATRKRIKQLREDSRSFEEIFADKKVKDFMYRLMADAARKQVMVQMWPEGYNYWTAHHKQLAFA